jgi:hypothetical protein
MNSREQVRTLSTALFNAEGIPQYFHISPNADLIPILVTNVNEEVSTFQLGNKSIAHIVTQELPSIVNALDINYTNKEFNKVRNRLVKALTEQLKHIESPVGKVPRKHAHNSIAGHFYKNNKWISFAIYRDPENANNVLLRYARRGVGVSIRSVTNSSFNEVFNSLFNFACKKIGIKQDDRTLLIRALLKEHLEKEYTQLLEEGQAYSPE